LIMAMLEQLNFPRWSQQLSRTYIITQNQWSKKGKRQTNSIR
jgi:hypothetical protein